MQQSTLNAILLGVAVLTWGWTWTVGLMGLHSIFEATFWLISIQLGYFVALVFLPMMDWTMLRRIYTTAALSVALMFWILVYVDKELIQSSHLQVSWLLNHLQHTVPVILALLSSKPSLDKSRPFRKTPVVVVVALIYLVLLGLRFLITGVWTYPFLARVGPMAFWPFVLLCLAGVHMCEWTVTRFF